MLPRGFKSEAERISLQARELVGLPAHSPLPARKLAAAMSVVVAGPRDIPGLPDEVVTTMLVDHARKWSGFTFSVEDRPFIIHNTSHDPERQESDLMHELAHIWRKHKPGRIEPAGRLPFATRSFDPDQEEEAKWLGACFQIPREPLLHFIRRKYDLLQIASYFGSSIEMARYRTNTSGVKQQLARAAAYRRH